MLRDVFYYGKKPNVHPREKFASSFEDAKLQNTTEHFWIVNEFCDYTNFDWDFDFDFLPDSEVWTGEQINIWPSQHQKDSGTWLCYENCTDIKVYRSDVQPVKRKNEVNENWVILENIDKSKFDFGWHPDPTDPPYIYKWGCKFYPTEIKSVLEYHVPGATQVKYMPEHVILLPNFDLIKEQQLIDKDKFDISWRPDPREPAYIYIWGNKYIEGTVLSTFEYHCLGATQTKFMPELVPVLPEREKYNTLIPVDSFDYSWRPNPTSPPYIYVFGNQWNDATTEPTIEYHVEGATDRKYITDIIAKVSSTNQNWKTLIPVESFDYSWRPNPHSPPYIYVFGNKWNDSATEPTIEYHVPGATEYKYMDYPVAITKAELSYWQVSDKNDLKTFDFSWRPNPFSPPQIYQWEDNGPRYTVPDATEVVLMKRTEDNLKKNTINRYYIKTNLDDLVEEHSDEVFWALNPDLSYEKFDFNWKPDENNFRHINVFGNEYSKNTQTYYVNGPLYKLGHREFNYVENQQINVDSSKLDMFFIDRYNTHSQQRFEELKSKFPQIQKTRYLNSWVDTINRCISKSSTKFFWVLSSELDYTDFIFDFYPSPWQEKMVHVFGTQWSHWGNTYFVNKESFIEDTKYVKVIEHLSVLNFVKSKKAKATDVLYDIVYIDHGNKHIEGSLTVPYTDNYLTTFKNMIAQLPIKKDHYVWVVSSICEYDNFDFTYICDPFTREQLHVFPSDKQKFGDTFLVNVNKLRELIDDIDILEDYNKINFNQHQRVKRLPPPVFVTNETHTNSLRDDYNFPYAVYATSDNEKLTKSKDNEPISLWNSNKDILITSTGGSRIVAPKEVKSYVKTELYDYPFIKSNDILTESKPLDIIFFSNGEVGADENYEHLLFLTAGMGNRVVRVDGVQGRVASQHAAANISQTPWYFLVNAKLRVNKNFDFSWQPDRLQIPKHYIFLATNPVNKLEYGHQAIVANNKTLTLNTDVKGLDYTMDSEHEVVNVNSGVGMFNTSPWDTWRTSFREVIKLRHSNTDENKVRLDAWLNVAEGNFSEYSLLGAKDAIEYYEAVNGDFDKLKLSYDWPWLREQFDKKYK